MSTHFRTLLLLAFGILLTTPARGNRLKACLRNAAAFVGLRNPVLSTKDMVDEILKTPPPTEGKWASSSGGSVPLAYQLVGELNARQPARWRAITLMHHATLNTKWGKRSVNPIHNFIVERNPKNRAEEIIIDPCYRQYISGGAQLGLPEIFVGTRQELIAVFSRHRNRIMPLVNDELREPIIGEVDPEEFVQVHYGFGGFEENRSTDPFYIEPPPVRGRP